MEISLAKFGIPEKFHLNAKESKICDRLALNYCRLYDARKIIWIKIPDFGTIIIFPNC